MKFDIFFFFSRICWANSSFIKIQQAWRVLYMKMFRNLWQYLAELFLEGEMFKIKVIEKIETHILCSITFFRKSRRLWDNVEKYGGARETVDGNMAHVRCMMISKAVRTQAQANAHTPTHTRNNAHPRTRDTHTKICSTCFSTATVVSRTLLNGTLYVRCLSCLHYVWGYYSSVGIETRYRLEGPGIESPWGEIFRSLL
jgi:hypothetical protein